MKKLKFILLSLASIFAFNNLANAKSVEYDGKVYELKAPINDKNSIAKVYENENNIILILDEYYRTEKEFEPRFQKYRVLLKAHQNNFINILNGYYDKKTLTRYDEFSIVFFNGVKQDIKDYSPEQANRLKELASKFASNEKGREQILSILRKEYLK